MEQEMTGPTREEIEAWAAEAGPNDYYYGWEWLQRFAALAFAAGAGSSEDARDAAYYKWRLEEILPLFEEARDALPAITLWSAKARGIRLCLGDRMDAAGTRTRADFDDAMKGGNDA